MENKLQLFFKVRMHSITRRLRITTVSDRLAKLPEEENGIFYYIRLPHY